MGTCHKLSGPFSAVHPAAFLHQTPAVPQAQYAHSRMVPAVPRSCRHSRSEFEAWDGTAAHHWPALPPGALDGPVGLRPEVCEAVARALERLPAGLRVQLVEVGVGVQGGGPRKARVLHVTM